MSYQVFILHSAEKELDNLSAALYPRIKKKLLTLEEIPRPKGVKKLSGREEYRLRIGDYRVLYSVDDKQHVVTVIAIGHRRDVYK